jgi:hypothetical protein
MKRAGEGGGGEAKGPEALVRRERGEERRGNTVAVKSQSPAPTCTADTLSSLSLCPFACIKIRDAERERRNTTRTTTTHLRLPFMDVRERGADVTFLTVPTRPVRVEIRRASSPHLHRHRRDAPVYVLLLGGPHAGSTV